ncbi:hypothetical protein BH11ARM2_BH11ARM2_21970 [soil metagenome]
MSATLEAVKAISESLDQKGGIRPLSPVAIVHLQHHPEDRLPLLGVAEDLARHFLGLEVAIGGFHDPENGSITLTLDVLTKGDPTKVTESVLDYADGLESILPSGTPFIMDVVRA